MQKIDHPEGEETQFVATNVKKDKTKKASHHDGDDVAVYEAADTMYVIKHKKTKQVLNTHSDYNTAKDEHEGLGDDKHEYGVYKQTKKDAALRNRNTYREEVEMKKREDIVMGMKKSKADLKKRYGDRWKSVMYATATKNAMKEAVEELEEASKDKINAYRNKSADEFRRIQASGGKMDNKQKRRYATGSGAGENAFKKVTGRARVNATEEVELDEISKAMLGRYIKKAKSDVTGKAYQLGARDPLKPKASWSKALGREKHIDKAVDRLTKEEVELDEAAPKMKGDSIKIQREKDRAHDAAMGRTPTGRKKPVRQMTSTQRSLASMRNEEVESLDETFKAGSMKLKDGSSATVTKESADVLNSLFKQLNSANKTKMEERLMSGTNGFNEILAFAKEAV